MSAQAARQLDGRSCEIAKIRAEIPQLTGDDGDRFRDSKAGLSRMRNLPTMWRKSVLVSFASQPPRSVCD
jgi:hypothetical protein